MKQFWVLIFVFLVLVWIHGGSGEELERRTSQSVHATIQNIVKSTQKQHLPNREEKVKKIQEDQAKKKKEEQAQGSYILVILFDY
jgi:hypothetical protein